MGNKQPLQPFKIAIILLYGTQPWITRKGWVVEARSAKLARCIRRPSSQFWGTLDYLQRIGVVLSWTRPSPGLVSVQLRPYAPVSALEPSQSMIPLYPIPTHSLRPQ